MVKRATLNTEPAAGDGGLYFPSTPKENYFRSGSTMLDLVNGGGWRENRIINIVGDKSTGKTLLAIEAAANYRRKYHDAPIRYVEVESAFDLEYAQSIGLPKDGVKFPNEKELKIDTVEAMERDLYKVIERGERSLYIVDSLDALSDEAEQERDASKGTYGTNKAKQMSALFRKLNSKLTHANITVIIISQVRDAIGVTFGKKEKRSGGKALDFYASQVIWLTHLARLKKTWQGVTRPYGVQIKAQSEKSKVGMPFREVEFPIYFTYGVEDVVSMVDWLQEVKRFQPAFAGEKDAAKFLKRLERLSPDEYRAKQKEIRVHVKRVWADIESHFVVNRRKYN